MKRISQSTLARKAVRAFRAVIALDIPLRAAYAGYFIVLSVFPALLLILSSLRFTGLEVEGLVELLDGILPGALLDTAKKLIYSTYRSSSGTIATVSLLVALWSSSKGIFGLLTGLNAVYGVSEDRGYFYTRGISVLYALAFYLVVILTLVLHVFGGMLIAWMRSYNDPVLNYVIDILNLRFFLLLVLQVGLFTAMFMFLPNRRNGFLASVPGGLLSALGWQVFSDLYSIYVTNFSGYSNLFGSVYAIALSMLWLYFCLSILFYGGALNRFLQEANMKKSE